MTVNDPLVSFFGPATPTLGQVAGLSPADSGRVLREGLPLLVQALADTDRTPEGRAAIDQAYAAIPNFSSVDAALNAPGGASELMQAGEVLSANVLREPLPSLASRLGSADSAGTTRLLQLALPLLLSLLAGRGMRPGDLVGMATGGSTGTAPVAAGLTATGLIETLRGRLGGSSGEALGRAAGFTASTAGRAASASLPVLLAAIARKGQDEAGAADLLNRSRDLEDLAAGPLPTDPAEVARLEGQGRPLVTHLFGSADAVTGRLGSAVGGSGASAGKLLALLAPVVLGLLGREARATGTTAAGLSRVLGEVPGLLPGLIPPGMSGLSALLNPPTVAAATPQVRAAPAPRPSPTPATSTTTSTTTVTQTRRRGGFPWWLIPLLLLLGLGGCWLTQQNDREPATASAPAATQQGGESILVTNPTSDADLPAEAFVMSGTAAPGVTLTISDEGDEVAAATVDDTGNWEAQIPAPTPGEHTYTVEGSDGTRSQFKVNIVDDAAAATGDGESILVTNPTAGANLPAEPFEMSGTATPGITLTVSDQGQEVATATVDDAGNWQAQLPAPTLGEHVYTVEGSDGTQSQFRVNVVEDDASDDTAASDGQAQQEATEATTPAAQPSEPASPSSGTPASGATTAPSRPAAGTPAAQPPATPPAGAATEETPDTTATEPTEPAAAFTIAEPAADAELPAGGFTLSGTGEPGQSVQILEDGTSLGTVTVADDGTWSLDVPSPVEGAHTYAVQDEAGTELTSVSVTVAAADPNASAATCDEPYSLSISDGQTVSEPFRFGGVGAGEGYLVTVRRGERVVGTKRVLLDSTCGWSYQSRPGPGEVTYDVRPLEDPNAEPLSTVNLTVAN
ncbi:DUF937 domain-containing protein [Deinococcus sp. SDU3-2]|uniref:DUF937 domain-containing protein n=1 Tax=Deinococcus terrestris TaxID=2651870 RepID=A0A7X1NXM1_9DEIO|nr:DUF937 domain-containing protein [Deinococcus terrestris]MPY67266.1 DUF937 domain-containing protein [Deinococcus terrestris]